MLNLKYKNLCSKVGKKLPHVDFLVILALFFLPSLFTWIPFVIQGGIYGDAGPWCWLKAFDSNCSAFPAVFILESVYWNVPFGIVLIFCLICVSIYLIFFLYVTFCHNVSHKKVASILFDTFILFLFFTFYTTLCIIEIIALMFVHTHKAAGNYSWLVLYAITLPIGEISLSLSSFVHFFRILCKSRKPKAYRRVNNKDISVLSHNGSIEPSFRISAMSHTSQQKRPALLSPSTDEWTSIHPEANSKYGTLES